MIANCSEPDLQLPDWRQWFPFPEWRAAQAQGLNFIRQALTQADDIFLEAPTGIGKSAMAIALAQSAASINADTYISTTTISLEDQYMRDFSRFGLQQLHAKSHYFCPECRSCDVGSRQLKRTDNAKFCRCQEGDCCSYRVAKSAFQMASFAIANAAYMCTCARFASDWTSRKIAVFDEAHLLHDTISGGYSFEIKNSEIDYFPAEGEEPAWLEQHYAFKLAVQIRELEEELDGLNETDPEIQRICQKLERAEGKQENLRKILATDPDQWVFDQQQDRLTISPLWATHFAADLLLRIGEKRVYLSATLPGFKHQARYLGIDPAEIRFLALPSPFPIEHRLIHICPVVKWNYHDSGPAIAQTCRALEKILNLHPSDRCLVHVSSYWQAREVVQQCRSKRLITHENARDKDVRLEEMFARPGAVLVSPSSHEGLDLYGDRSRFQVIAKLPFASLGDKRVKRRMEVDSNWYQLQTAQKFIQACGRSVRSDSDYAVTYVLDQAFDSFYHRASRFFPAYILDALRTQEVPV
jgi:Rad3-related DNA helicase